MACKTPAIYIWQKKKKNPLLVYDGTYKIREMFLNHYFFFLGGGQWCSIVMELESTQPERGI